MLPSFPGTTSSRRLKRAKEKAQQRIAVKLEASGEKEVGEAFSSEGISPGVDRLTAGDELESAVVLKADNRMRSFDFAPRMGRDGKSCRILVALHNNSMEVWGLEGLGDGSREEKGDKGTKEDASASCSRMAILDMQGHRSDVRAVAVSSDGTMLASVSHGLVKLWNSRSRRCVRSTPCGFGLAIAFAPGNRHLLVGTKEGNLQVMMA